MYCTKCGNKLETGQNYCTHCGKSTNQNTTANQNNTNFSSTSLNQKQNNNGIISLILGILALLTFSKPLISIILATISIIIGKKYQKETGNNTVGPLLGIIGIILSILVAIIFIFYIFWTEEFIENVKTEYFKIIEENDYYNPEEKVQESFDLRGNSWIADDNSVLYLNNDQSYIWYQDDKVHTDNYYVGNYEFYTGIDAINYIATNLKEYRITVEEQQKIIQNSNYTMNDYYVIILDCTKTKINGIEQIPSNNKIYYYGFYDEALQYLSLVNIATNNQAGFTLQNKIANIDI